MPSRGRHLLQRHFQHHATQANAGADSLIHFFSPRRHIGSPPERNTPRPLKAAAFSNHLADIQNQLRRPSRGSKELPLNPTFI
jgi:hypothetical protein